MGFKFNPIEGTFDLVGESGGGTPTNTVGATCPSGVAVGDIVYVDGSGSVQKADASDISTAKAIGIVSSKSDSTTCTITLTGTYSSLTGLTPGAMYFLSETAGELTTTAPTTSGSVIVPIGIALTSTEIILNVSSVYTIRS